MKFKALYSILNFLVSFDTISGKNGRAIFINVWRKVDETDNCDWEDMAACCRVEGGY
jgi:hypothetical protein